jgi:transaldolase
MRSNGLRIKLFQDGADLGAMVAAKKKGLVAGFTTNPTLMRKAGVSDYKAFALKAITEIPNLPISFEVFSDDFATMEREAREIASWGGDTYVKIPITNTKGESAGPLIRKLSKEKFSLNVTAMLTLDQVETVVAAADPGARTIVSVFAGRIADSGVDPVPIMAKSVEILKSLPRAELLWASPREVLNVIQAEECGCHIITATPDIIAKMPLLGRDLRQYSPKTPKT